MSYTRSFCKTAFWNTSPPPLKDRPDFGTGKFGARNLRQSLLWARKQLRQLFSTSNFDFYLLG